MFAPPPLPLSHHRSATSHRSDSVLFALSASEALTSLLSSLPSLPLVSADPTPQSGRLRSVSSLSGCKVEEISDDDVDDATATAQQQQQHSRASRQESSGSARSRPESAGAYSQASHSTASSSHSFISALSPTPPNLPARSGPLTLQLATALQPQPSHPHPAGAPPPPLPQPAVATSLSSILDPHLLHLLYLYSSRSLSPFNEHSIWSCFLSHLQQPDPAGETGHRLPLCDKQYQRSSRRSFKNHVWKCLCRHFPSIAKYTYSEFRRLCATDRTVMAGFHAVTLFPRPQKKRRSTAELSDGERWLCPHGCGQEYRNTSSTSIGRHLRKECRLKDMSEEEKQEERQTLRQHEQDVAAYQQALRTPSSTVDMQTRDGATMGVELVASGELLPMAYNKRVRLSSTEPIALTISTTPTMRPSSLPTSATTVSLNSTTAANALPPVPTFSPSTTAHSVDAHQLPLTAAIALPTVRTDATASEVTQQPSLAISDSGSGRGVRVMSTAEIALLEAQLMDTMHTQLVIDRLLADMTARGTVPSVNTRSPSGEGPVVATNSGGDVNAADAISGWHRGNGVSTADDGGEMGPPSHQSVAAAAAHFSPPRFVSMSNAPSPSPPNPRQLQRPTDASASRRLAAMQATAATLGSPPLSTLSPPSNNRSTPPVRHSLSASSTVTAAPPLELPSAPPSSYPLLTSDEAVAVIRQQLSLRCVSFLSQPGRDIRQLPSVLLQVVAGLPVAMGSAMVHDTLRASALEANGRAVGAVAALQRHSEHHAGSGNTTGAASNSSTPVPSSFANNGNNDYHPSPSAHSASSGSSALYTAYSASSSASTSLSLFPSAASILLSPLSMFDPHRLLSTPPLDVVPATSSFSSPAQCPPSSSLALSPSLSTLMPLPSVSSSPPPQTRSMAANLAQLHDWLSLLPSSTASLYRQRLMAPSTQPMPTIHDVGGPRDEDGVGAAASLLRPYSHSDSHAHSQPAALTHTSLAAAGQQKLLQLATPRGAPPGKSSRACQTGNM